MVFMMKRKSRSQNIIKYVTALVWVFFFLFYALLGPIIRESLGSDQIQYAKSLSRKKKQTSQTQHYFGYVIDSSVVELLLLYEKDARLIFFYSDSSSLYLRIPASYYSNSLNNTFYLFMKNLGYGEPDFFKFLKKIIIQKSKSRFVRLFKIYL